MDAWMLIRSIMKTDTNFRKCVHKPNKEEVSEEMEIRVTEEKKQITQQIRKFASKENGKRW